MKLTKAQALYVHAGSGSYHCDECPMWIRDTEQCTIHLPSETIRATGSCGYWVHGIPHASGRTSGKLRKLDTGYVENEVGLACKRCQAFVVRTPAEGDCKIVRADSPGKDVGNVHPDACCAAWVRDPTRGRLPLVPLRRSKLRGLPVTH